MPYGVANGGTYRAQFPNTYLISEWSLVWNCPTPDDDETLKKAVLVALSMNLCPLYTSHPLSIPFRTCSFVVRRFDLICSVICFACCVIVGGGLLLALVCIGICCSAKKKPEEDRDYRTLPTHVVNSPRL
jgi:hypothetical protein